MSHRAAAGPSALALGLALALSGRTAATQQDAPPSSTADGTATRVSLRLHGTAADGSVEFGRAFEFDVVRRWPSAATPAPWSPDALAPVVVRELGATRAIDGDETVETIRCRGFVFRRGAVTLLPAAPTPITLVIDSCLPAGDDGNLELLPAPPLGVRSGRQAIARLVAIGVATGIGAWLAQLLFRTLRRRTAVVPARQRLATMVDAIAGSVPTTRDQHRAEAVAATAILREAQALATAAPAANAAVDEALALLDDVKFARRELAAAERAQLIAVLRCAVAAVPEVPA